jgi:hypothetical protein
MTPEELAAAQQPARARVLRWFARAGHLEPADALPLGLLLARIYEI